MPKGTDIREILVDPDTKTRLENTAFMERTSVSELVRTILQEAVDGKYDDLQLTDRPVGRARISVAVDEELWEASGDKAWELRLQRSRMVREIVNLKYANTPLDRKKVVKR
jgi:hypothetical protein